MAFTVSVIILLVFFAGVANGITDTLQFHYERSFARKWNPQFWDPALSWKNKYLKDKAGNLLKPLEPRFFGSTTFLVFITDAWHLFKFLHYACLRVLLVWLALPMIGISGYWYNIAAYLALWASQAAGFHLFYTILKHRNDED